MSKRMTWPRPGQGRPGFAFLDLGRGEEQVLRVEVLSDQIVDRWKHSVLLVERSQAGRVSSRSDLLGKPRVLEQTAGEDLPRPGLVCAADRCQLAEVAGNHHMLACQSGAQPSHRRVDHGCLIDDDHVEVALEFPGGSTVRRGGHRIRTVQQLLLEFAYALSELLDQVRHDHDPLLPLPGCIVPA